MLSVNQLYCPVYLRLRPVAQGFEQRQQLYMLYDSLIIWSYYQRTEGRMPESNALSLAEWASPFVAYWKTFQAGGNEKW